MLKLITIISISILIPQISAMGMGFNPDSRFVEQITALKFGDACSFENEKSRQDLAMKLKLADMREAFEVHKQWQENVVNNNLLFCSALKLLICDQMSEKCVCGDSGNKAISPMTYKESNYVAEMRNNQTMCKMTAYCSPIDMFQSQESQCAMGTTCISSVDGSPCTSRTLGAFLYNNQRRSKQELADDTFMGKICSCRPIQQQQQGVQHYMPINNDEMTTASRNGGRMGYYPSNQNNPTMVRGTARPYAKLIVQRRKRQLFEAIN